MNTQTQEALKMAIEAMQITDEAFTEFSKGLVGLGIPASILKLDKQSRLIPAINACEEALEQPAQEPVAWMSKKRGDVSKAKMYFNEGEEILPLYTHPAPSWQGLSDDEIEYWECLKAPPVHPDFINDDSWREFARCIEAALREKNDKG